MHEDSRYVDPLGEPVDPYADAYAGGYVAPDPYAPPPGPIGYPAYGAWPGAPAAPPNPYGYAPYDLRPAPVLAASVLAYVLAGILLASGALLVFGASSLYVLAAAESAGGAHAMAGELAVAGLANLVVASVLITGGLILSDARRRRRTLLALGAGLTLAECVYWLARVGGDSGPPGTNEGVAGGGGVFFLALVYATLAIATLVLAFSIPATRWRAAAPGVNTPSATPHGG